MNWTDKIQVFNEDCMETMSRYEDDYFDLAVVDPPYGIDLANMNMGVGKSKKASKIKNRKWKPKDWDKSTPNQKYFDELFRVSKNQIIWGGNYFNLPPCYGYILWDKRIPLGLSFADCEMAWYSFKKAAKIFRYSAYKDKKEKIHPTQKPISLYQWIYQNYAKEGFKILDTHFGSGSNGIAIDSVNKIEKLNLSLVASEIDKDYYNRAKKRFEEKTAWSSLFV